MSPERFRRIEELYHAAREGTAEERAALLAQADPELRSELESLLTEPAGGEFLEQPAIAHAPDLPVDSTLMGLASGALLGPYRIEGKLGEGGMGEVFRAIDTRLGRAVAIKTTGEQFNARFEREARAISALNHPNICTLYDVGPNYLVMELVQGETLAARLKKGPFSIEMTLRYAAQIAAALADGHEKGIVHRDLKPGNIMVTKSSLKVLDFGLAKSQDCETITSSRAVMGTPAYMAPEQHQGGECDARTDIYALGLILYEMFTGKRPPQNQPAPVEDFPERLAHVIQRCLEREPEQRWQTARDVKLELEWIAHAPEAGARKTETPARRSLVPWFISASLAITGVVLSVVLWRARQPVDHPLMRLNVDLGPEATAGINLTVAISPDGRQLVYPAHGPDGKRLLVTRLLDQAQPTMLSGTEGGIDPFFSPDGQWIGFFADFQLKKLSLQGGAPVSLGTLSNLTPAGASWGQDGKIVSAIGNLNPLSWIPVALGPWHALTKLGPGETSHRWPQVLPGGKAVLFTASPSAAAMDNASIEAISLESGQVKIVQHGGYYGRYLPSGHLVYVHRGVLYGVRFDLARLEVRGEPVPLLQDMAANPATGGGQFDFSSTGIFVYAAGANAARSWQVAWLDSSGRMRPLLAAAGAYMWPRFSPDGTKLAFVGPGPDIYIHDLERDTTSRLTFNGHANVPVWAPDGKHLVFQSVSNGFGFYWTRSDAAGEPQRLLESQNAAVAWDFSPDGRRLAYRVATTDGGSDNGSDIWTLPLDLTDPDHPKTGQPEPFLRTPADERVPRFSPDGRWIAYRSNESGNNEIYVRPFPAASGGKWQISARGGLYAFWSNNGRELFYETADNRIMVVDYTVNGDSFVPGKPRTWSDTQSFYSGFANMDLAPDGKRFAVFALSEAAPSENGSVHVIMLLNFFDELRRRIP